MRSPPSYQPPALVLERPPFSSRALLRDGPCTRALRFESGTALQPRRPIRKILQAMQVQVLLSPHPGYGVTGKRTRLKNEQLKPRSFPRTPGTILGRSIKRAHTLEVAQQQSIWRKSEGRGCESRLRKNKNQEPALALERPNFCRSASSRSDLTSNAGSNPAVSTTTGDTAQR